MSESTRKTVYQYIEGNVLENVIETSPSCILIVDPQGIILEVNPTTEEKFGQSRDQLVGQSFFGFVISPDEHLTALFVPEAQKHTTRLRGIDLLIRTLLGQEFWASLGCYALGREEGWLLLIQDMSVSKAQHHELLRTTARLQHLIANLQGGILVEDETRHIVLINNAFCAMFGIPGTPEQLIGADCSQSAEDIKVKFRDPSGFVSCISEILENRQPVYGDILHLRNGRVFQRDYAPIYDQDEYVGHLWHYRDISDEFYIQQRWEHLRKLEEANREFIRLFLQLDDANLVMNEVMALAGHLFDVSRVYVFHFRENERILDNTHEWCAAGVHPEIENLKNLHFDTLVPSFFPLLITSGMIAPTHISELPDDIRAILEPQSIQSVLILPLYFDNRLEGFIGFDEIRHPRKWLPEEITTVRIIAESYSRALEREQNRRAIIEARDEALRTAQLRSQFVANTSHEIRTPLTGTLGMLELLLETSLNELQHEFATEAFNSSSRLLLLINDLLDFSKLEAGQIVLEASPVDLRAIATEVRMTLVSQLKSKPVEIQLDIDDAVPYRIFGDATRIRQVLTNLMGNAIKFTKKGHVRLGIHAVQSTEDVALLRFSVQDTGIGIAPQHLDRIFESFVQADGSTTRKYGGSGLGLAISKQLVGLMGGDIHVKSTVGEGSMFDFSLRSPIAEAKSTSKHTEDAFSQLHILVIDENRTARYVLTQHLENWGVRVSHIDTLDEILSVPQKFYNLAFIRSKGDMDRVAAKSLISYTERVIFISNSGSESRSSNEYLAWPVDQSHLYNLLLQCSQTEMTEQEAADDHDSAKQSLGRVLIAEDHFVNVGLVKRALSSMPITVDVVANGQEVLTELDKQQYDLILMDIHMPVLDGVEATRLIRGSSKPYRNIPILALTASVTQSEKMNYLAEGMNEVIGKPFSLKHLRSAVLEWLEKEGLD